MRHGLRDRGKEENEVKNSLLDKSGRGRPYEDIYPPAAEATDYDCRI